MNTALIVGIAAAAVIIILVVIWIISAGKLRMQIVRKEAEAATAQALLESERKQHEKAVSMFSNKSIAKPILGIVENMSWFTPLEHPDERYYIFGRDGGAEMADRLGLELLGRIPLVQSIRESGDSGEPIALGSRPDSLAFLDIARRISGAAIGE